MSLNKPYLSISVARLELQTQRSVQHNVLKGKGECIYLQIYDHEKTFDALWLEDCMIDLFDNLPKEKRIEKLPSYMNLMLTQKFGLQKE